jgi:hypothetical protein
MDTGSPDVDAAVRARALADNAVLGALTVRTDGIAQAEEALAIARELDDRALLARVLTACIGAAAFDAQAARPYVAEAIAVARELGDEWRLSQILAWQAYTAGLTGHPVVMAAAGAEGQALADAVGDRFISRMCRYWGGAIARFQRGEVSAGLSILQDLLAEADADADVAHGFLARVGLGHTLLLVGRYSEARILAAEAAEMAPGLGPFLEPWAVAPMAPEDDGGPARIGHCQRRTDGGAGIRTRRFERGKALGGRGCLVDDGLAPGEGIDNPCPRRARPGRSGTG